MQASDMLNINSQLEHLQARYVGTGHADQGRFKWAAAISRDMYASYIGHHPMLAYIAISENESIGRERYNFMQKLTRPRRYYMPDSSDTDNSGSDNSRTATDENVSQPVRFSTYRTAEAVLGDQEEFSVPNSVSDTEPYHDNMPDTSYTEVSRTVSDTPVSQSVPSSPCGIAEAVLGDQEEFSVPNSVSDTEPYHDNMPDTSYTEVSRTASDTPVSQSVLSNPCGIAEAVLADLEEFSDPNSVSDTGPYHDNMPDTSHTEVSKTASDTPVSQSVPSSPSGTDTPVRKVRTLQELYETTQVLSVADPNSVSESGPYHDNMPDTSQSVPSSPCGIENASPLRTPSGENASPSGER